MDMQEIIAERNEAKARWETHAREADRYRLLTQALDEVIRLKGITAQPPTITAPADTPPSSNGTNPETTRKEILFEILREKPKLTVGEIRQEFNTRKIDIKDHYLYNLLTTLYKAGKLDREDGRYFVG